MCFVDVLFPQNKNLKLSLPGVKSRIKDKNENVVWFIRSSNRLSMSL